MENQLQTAATFWEIVSVAGGALLIIMTALILPLSKWRASLSAWQRGIEKDISAIKERIEQDEKATEKDVFLLKERLDKEEKGQDDHNKKFYDLIDRLESDHSEIKEKIAEIAASINAVMNLIKSK